MPLMRRLALFAALLALAVALAPAGGAQARSLNATLAAAMRGSEISKVIALMARAYK